MTPTIVCSGSAFHVRTEEPREAGVLASLEMPGERLVVRFENREELEKLCRELLARADEVWPVAEQKR